MKRVINIRPGRRTGFFLALLPFLLLVAAYMIGSDLRLEANPNDKLLPPLEKIGAAIERVAFNENRRTGEILLWSDTQASLIRLGAGIAIATLIGLVVGIATGLIPVMGATFSPVISVISVIPPLALLPILFIVVGLGEASKIVLIVVGIAPFLIRDMALRTTDIPAELLIKAQTLGASTWQIVTRVVLPQVLPRLIDAIRLALGPAWLFLIAAEAIASTDGLGYRIFLVRRYLAMDVILPYVAWITILAYASDLLLAYIQRKAFPWFDLGRERS